MLKALGILAMLFFAPLAIPFILFAKRDPARTAEEAGRTEARDSIDARMRRAHPDLYR